MLDVPASLAHFHARQRPAAHKHAHSQHTLQGEGTQAGGWGVGVPDCTFFEPGGRSQRGRVASSAPSARRARPHINTCGQAAGGPRQFGCRRSSQRRLRAVSRAARARHRDGEGTWEGEGGAQLARVGSSAATAADMPRPTDEPPRFSLSLHFAQNGFPSTFTSPKSANIWPRTTFLRKDFDWGGAW